MNKIYTQINELTNGRYRDLRFSGVDFNGNRATVTVVHKKENADEVRSDPDLKKMISDICAFNTAIGIEFVEEDDSPRDVRDCVRAFTDKFPYVASIADDITVTPDPLTVHLRMFDSMLGLAKSDYLPRLDEYLKNRYTAPIAVKAVAVEYADVAGKEEAHEPKSYAISQITPVIGNISAGTALSVADVNGNNDNITVCGVITMITDFLSKGSGVKRSRPYTKFLLYDGESTLQCRCFPKDDAPLFAADMLNKPFAAFGNTVLERGRTGEISMTANALSLISAEGLSVLESQPEPAEYINVRPRPYEEYVQASLFQSGDSLPRSLAGNFVAFDFETTGLSIFYDKPTELGAVKIVDGVITETFSTLIDPKRPIPEEVSKKTGITDDMVKGKPLFEDVLQDFYKFSYGCSLIGHNIAFDFPFLVKYGNKYGWAFGDRKTYDTMGMAPRALPGIDVLTLDNVLEKLGLVNDNAHRALSDATATAKAFIAMNKLLYK